MENHEIEKKEINQSEPETKGKNKKKTIIIISIIVLLIAALGIGAAWFLRDYYLETSTGSNQEGTNESDNSETKNDDDSLSGSNADSKEESKNSGSASNNNSSKNNSSKNNSSKNNTSKDTPSKNNSSKTESENNGGNSGTTLPSYTTSESEKPQNISSKPTITISAQVSEGVCVIGGICSKNTEYVTIAGGNEAKIKVIPFAGGNYKYFISQVEYFGPSYIVVAAKEKGKDISDGVSTYVTYQSMSNDLMARSEYSPVFGLNSRMHFYSALLSYSLSTDKLTDTMISQGRKNISQIVSAANSVGAETIFLIIPSSAEIYPETVPEGYSKNTGESLFDVFSSIATDCGAKVIYPLETMKAHSNDGEGYQIYQHTDSHWSTYGSYWGTYDLLQYISKSFPNAKPRTLQEMGFYTTELYGGDALFNFPRNTGFENSYGNGVATLTRIKELTTLYSLKMPTSTLGPIYNYNVGLYLTEYNSRAATVNNPNGAGLPTAVIMRDSFGKVSYDMLNDRFKTVYWGEFDNYRLPIDKITSGKPDYVIYLYSERNLLKILLNNSGASLLNLR